MINTTNFWHFERKGASVRSLDKSKIIPQFDKNSLPAVSEYSVLIGFESLA